MRPRQTVAGWPRHPGDIETNGGELEAYGQIMSERERTSAYAQRIADFEPIHDHSSRPFFLLLQESGWWPAGAPRLLDIGAGTGSWARELIAGGHAGSVTAFEPNPDLASSDARQRTFDPIRDAPLVGQHGAALLRYTLPYLSGTLVDHPDFGRVSQRLATVFCVLDNLPEGAVAVFEDDAHIGVAPPWSRPYAVADAKGPVRGNLLFVGPSNLRTLTNLSPTSVAGRMFTAQPPGWMVADVCESFLDEQNRESFLPWLEQLRHSEAPGPIQYDIAQIAVRIDEPLKAALARRRADAGRR